MPIQLETSVLCKVLQRLHVPEKVTIDKSGAHTAAVHGLVADSGLTIELRQSKSLNNLVEQDHRAIKRRTRPMLGFKDFHCAVKIIASIETMPQRTQRHIPSSITTCGYSSPQPCPRRFTMPALPASQRNSLVTQ